MHNYTRLQLDELRVRCNKEREKEWASLDSDAKLQGAYGSGAHSLLFYKYIV